MAQAGGIEHYEIRAPHGWQRVRVYDCPAPLPGPPESLVVLRRLCHHGQRHRLCAHRPRFRRRRLHHLPAATTWRWWCPVDDRGLPDGKTPANIAGLYYEAEQRGHFGRPEADPVLCSPARNSTHELSPLLALQASPIIFRATPQWFCSVEAFKDEAVEGLRKRHLAAGLGRRAHHPAWCGSGPIGASPASASWGLPIPVFYCEECGKPVCTDGEHPGGIRRCFAADGSNAWYEKEAADILPEGFRLPPLRRQSTSPKEAGYAGRLV